MTIEDEKAYADGLIRRIVEECPRRAPTSDDERRASHLVKAELEELGLQASLEPFEFNESLYANLALHFGLGALGTAVSGVAPHLALALHLLAGVSYWAESTKRKYLLRRLLPQRESQNVVALAPAAGDPSLRIVLLSHVDAATTGLIFDPMVMQLVNGKLPKGLEFLDRGLEVATRAQLASAGIDLARMMLGPAAVPLRPLELLLGAPGVIVALGGLEVALRNDVVPGANDNLSGVAAVAVLADRLASSKPDDVELVFVATGCEEASLGGADALIKSRLDEWSRENTVAIAVDGICNGQLRYLEGEGEIDFQPTPPWLLDVVHDVVASEERFAPITGFEIPVGATDIAAFRVQGYDGIGFVAIEPELGTPRHYHLPGDTPDNLDLKDLMYGIDFIEAVVRRVIQEKVGDSGADAGTSERAGSSPTAAVARR